MLDGKVCFGHLFQYLMVLLKDECDMVLDKIIENLYSILKKMEFGDKEIRQKSLRNISNSNIEYYHFLIVNNFINRTNSDIKGYEYKLENSTKFN